MSKGTHAKRAENRERAIAEREAPFRRRIAELEAQVAKLDKANLDQQATYLAEIRDARQFIAANTSDRLDEALRELTSTKRTLEISETARRVAQGSIHRLGDALQAVYEEAGMKRLDAREAVLRVTRYLMAPISDDTPGFIKVDDLNVTAEVANASKRGMFDPLADADDVAKMHRLQRAKGLRS